jgi:site-specific recombinase XerD
MPISPTPSSAVFAETRHAGSDPATLQTFLLPANADKDTRSRVSGFIAWMIETKRAWHDPDLAAYRDHLQAKDYHSATISAHLSSVRGAYQRLLRNNALRATWFDAAGVELHALRAADTPANRKAFVDERYIRLQNAIDPQNSLVHKVTSQDKADSAQVRLTRAQAEALMRAPGLMPLSALRDTALIALMLCTGIREAEACALEVDDLRQKLGGELALHVRNGKGSKERLIPYGDLAWVLVVLDKWLEAAGISEGRVFRSFWRGGQSLRGPLSVRAVENIVSQYPVVTEHGKKLIVHPHDLRRTYARRLYEEGLDLVSISQNLGHASTRTTLLYIGELGADRRRAPGVYSFDLTALDEVEANA